MNLIPSGLPPIRTSVLTRAVSKKGTREATGKNDGDVLEFVPPDMRGKELPYCCWFTSWVFKGAWKLPYERYVGGVWDLYNLAREAGHIIEIGQEWPAMTIQPGDLFLVFHGSDYKTRRVPGHIGFGLRVNDDSSAFNSIEGNFRNSVGVATRSVSDLTCIVNPYKDTDEWSLDPTWERGLVDAPKVGAGLANTR